jgi:predicted nuclease with RNAse H fold
MIPESLTLTPSQVKRMRELRSRGLQLSEISGRVGVPRSTVHAYVADIKLRRSVIDDSIMMRMLDEGHTHETIALRFKVTRHAVTMRLARARGRKRGRGREITPDQVARASQMRSDGLSYGEVAKILGFDKGALWRRLKREESGDDGSQDEAG